MTERSTRIAIVGTGITGIATAYHLCTIHGLNDILPIDAGQPMAFTSAQSGENYRNWWPHPAMVQFTNRSIDLMEEIAVASNDRINMKRRGYALTTRESDIDELVKQLHDGLGDSAENLLRFHDSNTAFGYDAAVKPDWQTVPVGVDILRNKTLISNTFPSYDNDIESVIHIRRGGDISGQQLGMHMLETIREKGGRCMTATVENITQTSHFTLELSSPDGSIQVQAENVVNAAGPFADIIANMLGVELPVYNTFQQKIAFEDKRHAIPRDLPFSIDLDSQHIDWSDEDRSLLLDEPSLKWLAEEMPGSIHCRPDGGDNGTWIKLGWTYNDTPQEATRLLPLDEHFPDIVLRGASRLNPALKDYYGQLTRSMHHYGGWYTMTTENWPLIGSLGPSGTYVNCAMSGFGTMAACAAGELCAATIAEAELPEYARFFSLERYNDKVLMDTLFESNKGVL